MSYKKTEELFSRDFMCDKKHKLNTSPKAIPTAILDEIETKGLTLERIEELTANGYDIYKYATQITLHGTCDELSKDGRIGWYKCLALNKNKSIGIKWIAVDREKKERIIDLLEESGWKSVSNSTELYPQRVKRVSDAEEAKTVAEEWKADIDRIDHSLFYGTSSIFLARGMFGVYVVCNLIVNGIKESNVNTLIEQATGKSIAEIETKRTARLKKEKEERDRRDAEYERSRAKREEEAAAYNEKFIAELRQSYKEVVSNEQPVGTVVAVVKRDYDGKYKLSYYRIEKRTAKPCHEDGSDDYFGGENKQKLIRKPCRCFMKVSV